MEDDLLAGFEVRDEDSIQESKRTTRPEEEDQTRVNNIIRSTTTKHASRNEPVIPRSSACRVFTKQQSNTQSEQSPRRSQPNRKGKPRGLQAARKLRTTRRENRWADKHYKRQALGTAFRFSPFGGSSHAKGIVLEKIGVEAKQPNSAIRKCVRVQLIKNGKKITAFVPNDGCLNFVDENDEVLIAGFGRSGHAVGDLPGVRFKVVKVSGVSLLALWKEKKEKPRS
ncbi:40S ribosomal protein S23 [Linnemannia schmuckeri]|uniref:40S ribosomal protein S23 n=2 Tax=Linnemannia TaxID=2779861 RepID=A0A9P5S2A6_9FUNG|nr:40S ribosomal protein S23 [Linnemannia schmuckeri]